jgi:predicted porin
MIGGLLKSTSSLAIVAAAGIFMGALSPASAADLGGDCCADLEERVAELEATTVRKGNRNVSVTLYGWVNQAVLWYDNGEESDVYVVDNWHAMSRIGVKGEGKVRPGVAIGYRLEIAANREGSGVVGFNDADDSGSQIFVRQNYWYIRDDNLGTLSVGHQYPATSGTWAVDMGGAGTWEDYVFGGTDGFAPGWFGLLPSFDPGRLSVVKYTTPSFAGFTVSASWGEDDRWDAGILYSNTFGTIAVSAGAGYFQDTDGAGGVMDGNVYAGAGVDTETVWGGSIGLRETSSGIYGSFAYSDYTAELAGVTVDEIQTWVAKVGIRNNWSGMGETDIYALWQHADHDVEGDADMYGVGIGQDIDAVGATAYLSYKHYEADAMADDLQTVTAGMVVPF